MLAIVGVLCFVNSYLIIASSIVFGWFIVATIGAASLVVGICLIPGLGWAYSGTTNLAVLNLFIGFIEMIASLSPRYAILGWIGLGQAVGASTLVLSFAVLYLLNRSECKDYFRS